MTTTAAGTSDDNPSKQPFPSSSTSNRMDKRRVSETPPESSHQLQKFSLPVLKPWGRQRVLRCVKVSSEGPGPAPPPRPSTMSSYTTPADKKARSRDVERFDKIRAHLVSRLRDEAGNKRHVARPASQMEDEHAARDMPWSFRTRRGSYGRPEGPSAPPPPPTHIAPGGGDLESGRAESSRQQKRQHRPLFSVTLSKVEIEYDVYALTGRRAARRPRKRPRALKRQLDMLFPGYHLSEAAAESYQVPEPPLPLPDA